MVSHTKISRARSLLLYYIQQLKCTEIVTRKKVNCLFWLMKRKRETVILTSLTHRFILGKISDWLSSKDSTEHIQQNLHHFKVHHKVNLCKSLLLFFFSLLKSPLFLFRKKKVWTKIEFSDDFKLLLANM